MFLFWEIFFPVFSALLASKIVFELIYFIINFTLACRELNRIEKKANSILKEGGIDKVYDFSNFYNDAEGFYKRASFPLTSSGNQETNRPPGMYL